jgi:probable rRNA maturation factor
MTVMTRRRHAPPAMRRRPRSLRIEIVVDCPLWTTRRHAQGVLRRAVTEAACAVATGAGELAIVLTDDSKIRELNRQWRRKNAPTNVLSFSAAKKFRASPLAENRRRMGKRDPRSARAGAAQVDRVGGAKTGRVPLLGDIVIAYETTEREARAERKPFAHHLAHLAVHGFLHLAGYDHATDRQAKTMEKLEAAILSRLDVPDPYTGRSAAM